jgi:hypothetical protein
MALLSATIKTIKRELPKGKISVSDFVRTVVEPCQNICPHKDWKRLLELDFQGELDKKADWLKNLFDKEPPKKKINGLWFQLSYPVLLVNNKEVVGLDMELFGSNTYDSDEPYSEWPCDIVYCASDEYRYLHSELLNNLYRIAYLPSGLKTNGEFPVAMAFGSYFVKSLINNMRVLPKKVHPNAGVAIGYDDSPITVLGELPQGKGVPPEK